MAVENEKIIISFEGLFTTKLKERITKYVEKHLREATDSERNSLIAEYTKNRDFSMTFISPTKLTCFLIK